MPEEQVVDEQVVDEQLDDSAPPEADSAPGDQVDQIERLAGKVKGLIALTEQNRTELAEASEENEQLRLENEDLRAQLVTAESTSAELVTVMAERRQVRSRVEELLEQLEAIDI
jgi:regulator of replication initiation timing